MDDEENFAELIRRVRAGDEDACTDLVRRYEPHLRRIVRVRFVKPTLQARFDTNDVCQSVFTTFFVRVALGEFDLGTPSNLRNLLGTMARNRLTDKAKLATTTKYGVHREQRADAHHLDLAESTESPSEIVQARELVAKATGLFSDEERYVLEQRRADRSWQELADELGSSPDAVRMGHARAVKRVAGELGLLSTGD